MYGPKGIGALYVRRSRPACASSRRWMAADTSAGCARERSPCPSSSGFGRAAEICIDEGKARERAPVDAARQACARLSRPPRRGLPQRRRSSIACPGNLNISFNFVEGEGLMMAIKDVAVSRAPPALRRASSRAMCCARWAWATSWRTSSIRFGLGRFNTEEEVDYVADLVVEKVTRLRDLSPLYEMHQGWHRSQERAVGRALKDDKGGSSVELTEQESMAYSDKVIEHYENPRNVGTLDKDDPQRRHRLGRRARVRRRDAAADQGQRRGVIEDAKFKTFGCGSAIASALARDRMDQGQDASTRPRSIKNTQIVEELDLPPVKIHCSVLAEDAIKSAIADYRKKQADRRAVAIATPAPSGESAEARA